MRTMPIHTPGERLAARQRGERRAAVSLLQLLCAMSILRTGLTRVLPLAGGASWWTLLLCLLPGAAVYLLACLTCRLTGADTLTGLVRRCLGQRGAWALSWVLAGLLLLDGAASITALITLFTEGIGTRGTQLTLALLTGGALLTCLHREGLARGTYLLRWVLLTGALVTAAQLGHFRADNLFPMQGGGLGNVGAALRAGCSLAWPVLLLLCLPEEKAPRRAADVLPALLGPVGALLLLGLVVPQERLALEAGLAECLLLPARYAPTAVRLLMHCLLMLAFFLSIGGAAQWGTELLCAPLGQSPRWLPWAVLAALTATQALDTSALWRMLAALEPWLLLPPAIIVCVCFGIAIIRREGS